MSYGLINGDLKGWMTETLPFHPAAAVLAFFSMILIFLSLKGVDRRDDVAHLTYIVSLMSAGVVMYALACFAAGRALKGQEFVIVCAIGFLMSGLRWGLQRASSAAQFMQQKIESEKK